MSNATDYPAVTSTVTRCSPPTADPAGSQFGPSAVPSCAPVCTPLPRLQASTAWSSLSIPHIALAETCIARLPCAHLDRQPALALAQIQVGPLMPLVVYLLLQSFGDLGQLLLAVCDQHGPSLRAADFR